ncbi:MAG TPA: MerR family transcriptional regulator [Steroidobacteraceae bacterium]|nr:MerR family transcriptional regulator [Steroidobacteraceae bacterium]
MKQRPICQITEAARLAGVSVRTLHHYDEIGLLVPKRRSAAGYRLYDREDLLRLQQILIGRELGLSLQEIGRSLDEPGFDLAQALRSQRQQLQGRAERTAAMLRSVDAALAILDAERGGSVDTKALFDGFDPSRYEEEVRQRWGDTDACKESAHRTSRYTEEDWKRLESEQERIYNDAATAMNAGTPPEDPAAMSVAERHRLLLDRWFYPCSKAMHRGLADMYEADARFAHNIDRHGKGLTPFLVAAIRANAALKDAGPPS